MRLFVALHLSRGAEKALIRAQDVLRRHGHGNFTRPENLHLTLAFIGHTQRIGDAIAALSQLSASAFTLTLDGLGQFGSDLYWAGIRPSPQLQSLQLQVVTLLEEEGFSFEDRVFQPHLTLCRRFRSESSVDVEAVERALGGILCPIRRVSLMESLQENGKTVYRERYGKALH